MDDVMWRKSTRSSGTDCAEAANWRKARASFSNGGCVEVGGGAGIVGVRDTQDRGGPVLAFPAAAWARFAAGLRA